MSSEKSPRAVAPTRILLVPIAPARARRFPAGWTGRVEPALAARIEEIDPDALVKPKRRAAKEEIDD